MNKGNNDDSIHDKGNSGKSNDCNCNDSNCKGNNSKGKESNHNSGNSGKGNNQSNWIGREQGQRQQQILQQQHTFSCCG
ncbi:hypothetical protein ACA910_015129 [Epithemia clementina (nom. ined.)]